MAIQLTGAGGLFTIIELAITAIETVNTHQGTTLPAQVDSVLAEMTDIDTTEGNELVASLASSNNANERASAVQKALRDFCEDLIIDRVVTDAPEVSPEIGAAIDELIRQMDGSADTVKENVTTAVVTTTPGTDSPTFVLHRFGVDGKALEGLVPEAIVGEFSSVTTYAISSGAPETDRLIPNWPGDGSGVAQTLPVEDTGLLANHSFDDEDDRVNTPDDWVITVGTVGTSVSVTNTEVQTITVTGGPPTSGHWTITHTRADGLTQTTKPLAHNATAGAVQSALREFTGFADVTVTLAGSVYTVNFNAVHPAGDQTLLTTSNNFDAGSLVVAESTAGDDALRFKALAILGDGAELTHLQQPLQEVLLPSTVYAWSLQIKVDAATTGTLVVELTDGANVVINDDEGNANSTSIDLSTMSTTDFDAQTGVFVTPKNMPDIYRINLRLSTAIANTKHCFLDEFILAQMTQLYTGGPFLVIFQDETDPQDGDRYVLTTTNDYAGRIQTWFWRMFERLLPSATGGAETIPDT